MNWAIFNHTNLSEIGANSLDDSHIVHTGTVGTMILAMPVLFGAGFFRLVGLIIFAALFGKGFALVRAEIGSVFQWIEFQIPILKMQVRFLPGLQRQGESGV